MVRFFYSDMLDIDPASFQIKHREPDEVVQALTAACESLTALAEWSSDEILTTLSNLAESIGWKRGDLLMAIRIAVTGRTVTPPLTESMESLGKEVALRRINEAALILKEPSEGHR